MTSERVQIRDIPIPTGGPGFLGRKGRGDRQNVAGILERGADPEIFDAHTV